jgi:hypothetical protein
MRASTHPDRGAYGPSFIGPTGRGKALTGISLNSWASPGTGSSVCSTIGQAGADTLTGWTRTMSPKPWRLGITSKGRQTDVRLI